MACLLGCYLAVNAVCYYIVEYNARLLLTIKRYKLTQLDLLFDIDFL